MAEEEGGARGSGETSRSTRAPAAFAGGLAKRRKGLSPMMLFEVD